MEEGANFDGEQAIVDAQEEKTSNMLDHLYILVTPVNQLKELWMTHAST